MFMQKLSYKFLGKKIFWYPSAGFPITSVFHEIVDILWYFSVCWLQQLLVAVSVEKNHRFSPTPLETKYYRWSPGMYSEFSGGYRDSFYRCPFHYFWIFLTLNLSPILFLLFPVNFCAEWMAYFLEYGLLFKTNHLLQKESDNFIGSTYFSLKHDNVSSKWNKWAGDIILLYLASFKYKCLWCLISNSQSY